MTKFRSEEVAQVEADFEQYTCKLYNIHTKYTIYMQNIQYTYKIYYIHAKYTIMD